MIELIKKLIEWIRNILKKEDTIEDKIKKFIKGNGENFTNKDSFEILKLNIKNSSKELFQLSSFKDYSIRLWQISEQASRPLLVMIMGEFKTGKSTFINAILEEEILKSDVTPATAVISMISYGEERKVLAHFKDDSTKEYSFDELKDITAEGDNSKKELRSSIKYVELFMPKEILKSITIIDTPGLNVDNQLHIQTTKEFMNEADMVFWVFAYGKAASRTEIAAINELSKRLKPKAIINRIDEIDEEEESLEDVIKDIGKRLKDSVDDIIGVSSYLAKKGILENDSKALSESRWDNFKNKLEKEILQKSKSLKIDSVIDKLEEYIEQLAQFLNVKNSELVKMEQKFTNKNQYKKELLEDVNCLESLLDESISLRKNKETVTINVDYLYECWEKNQTQQLNKITTPLNYLLKLVELLKLLGSTEKIISNIQSYSDIYDEILDNLGKINSRSEYLSNVEKQLSEEIKDQQRQVAEYNTSGIFGGAPLLDWHGNAKRLNEWQKDLKNRAEEFDEQCNRCKNDRINQFSRITRMNSEIYDYLTKIENVFETNINRKNQEINDFEKSYGIEKQNYELLKSEIILANKVILNLKNIIINNESCNSSSSEVAVTT